MSRTASAIGVIERLDEAIVELEAARLDAQRVLAASHGTNAEALALALKELDDKLLEAHHQRDELAKRMGSSRRKVELAGEMKAIRLELSRLAEADDEGARFQELRSRALALQQEALDLHSRS